MKRSLSSSIRRFGHKWNWAIFGVAVLYFVCALSLGFRIPGLDYDEALLQHGATHMLISQSEPPFAHDRGSWVHFMGRYWPLMVIPYAGALKAYLLLGPFALFGSRYDVARAVAALMGAFGIWGIAQLMKNEINGKVATAVAFILAIHPAYLDLIVFDSAAVALWMACLGFLCITLSHYIDRRTALASFWLGISMGLAVWGRANFVWFLVATFFASALILRKSILIPYQHLLLLLSGGLIGGAPFLIYNSLSHWATLRFMTWAQTQEHLSGLLTMRLRILSEVLLSDAEQRAIWNGPPLPQWQSSTLGFLLVLSLFVCLVLKVRQERPLVLWRRVTALTLICFAIFMLFSRLYIREHHLIALVPLAAVVIVLAFHALIQRWKKVKYLALAAGIFYVGLASYWDWATARGIRQTGGVNAWSDTIFTVNRYLETHYAGRQIIILDWGLYNSLYVLSGGEIRSSELFWGATKERSGLGRPWADEIKEGAIYLTNSGGNLKSHEPTEGFMAALRASGHNYIRKEFYQKGGAVYGETIEVLPGSAPPAADSRIRKR